MSACVVRCFFQVWHFEKRSCCCFIVFEVFLHKRIHTNPNTHSNKVKKHMHSISQRIFLSRLFRISIWKTSGWKNKNKNKANFRQWISWKNKSCFDWFVLLSFDWIGFGVWLVTMAFSQRGQNQTNAIDKRILADLISVTTKSSDKGTIFKVCTYI